jgi:hypothetical protein
LRSKLVNIRLDAERLRKTVVMRERGLSVSDVVRDAIDRRLAAFASEPRLATRERS